MKPKSQTLKFLEGIANVSFVGNGGIQPSTKRRIGARKHPTYADYEAEVVRQKKEHPWASTAVLERIARDHIKKGGG